MNSRNIDSKMLVYIRHLSHLGYTAEGRLVEETPHKSGYEPDLNPQPEGFQRSFRKKTVLSLIHCFLVPKKTETIEVYFI